MKVKDLIEYLNSKPIDANIEIDVGIPNGYDGYNMETVSLELKHLIHYPKQNTIAIENDYE
jgi:hypothetical protein